MVSFPGWKLHLVTPLGKQSQTCNKKKRGNPCDRITHLQCQHGIYPCFSEFPLLQMCKRWERYITKSIREQFRSQVTFGETSPGLLLLGKPAGWNLKAFWEYCERKCIDTTIPWSTVWVDGGWQKAKQSSRAIMHNLPVTHTSKTVWQASDWVSRHPG